MDKTSIKKDCNKDDFQNEKLIDDSIQNNSNQAINKFSNTKDYENNETTIITESENKNEKEKESLWDVLKTIMSLAFPTVLFCIGTILESTICLVFVNNTNNKNSQAMKDALGISFFIFNVSMFSIIIGLISGFEILGSSAFGAKKYKLVGVYLWRARIVAFVFSCLLLFILYYCFVPVLNFLKFSDEIIYYAQRFINIFVIVILAEVFFRSNYVYLNIADKSYVNTIIVCINLALHFLWCYLFIIVLDMDTLGAGISMLISQTLNAVISSLYISIYKPIPDSVFWINKKCFKDLWSYMKITLPSTFLICAEWWSFEILAIFALNLSREAYDDHVVVYNIYTVYCEFMVGVTTSLTIMCSSAIGDKDHIKARRYFKINFLFSLIMQIIMALILFLLANIVIPLFANDQIQTDRIKNNIHLLSIICIIDLCQFCSNSFAKSCGKLYVTFTICFISLYIIQPSLTFIFAFKLKLGLIGIWLACGASLIVLLISYNVYILTFDYNEIVLEMEKKINQDNEIFNKIFEKEFID